MINEQKTWEGILNIFEKYDVKPIKLMTSKELKESGLIEKWNDKILTDLNKIKNA
jgi:hypothetical protein